MVIALFAVLLVFMTEQLIEYFSRERTLEHERSHVLDNLSTLRARLEGVVNANFFLVNGLTAVIASRPDIDQEGFAAIARNMVDERHALRNIAAAPNMVISLMYPLEGNEAAVGLDYLTHPTQRQAAMRARDSRQAVVAGPLPLQQGGTGIIVRVPVFLEQSRTNDEPQFWGLVSAVLDVDRLYQQASLADSLRDFDLAIRGKDGTGSRGSVFYGDTTIYDHQPVTLSLTLPGGSWQLAAIPRGGWGQQGAGTGMIRLMGLLSALVAAAMAYRMARNHQIIRETADRLQQSQQRLLEAQCLAKLGGWELDQLTNELRWSDEVFRIFEIDKPRFGASYDAFLNSIHPDDRDAVDAAFKRSLATGESYDITHRLLFPDGRIKYVHETCEIFRDANGKPLRSVGTVQDVTERKQAEIQARKNEILLDSVFRALPDLFFLMDPDGTIRDFRAQQKEDLYISPDVFLGHRMQDVLPDEVGELFLGKLTEVINQGELATYEYDLPMAGGIRRFEARLTRLPESTQIIAVVREITQQYQDRIALSSSELRYRQLFEHNPAPLLVYEKGSLRILAVNEAFVQQYGYSRDEALALRLTDLYPEVEKQCISELAANLNGLVYAGEWHHLRKDGSSIIIDARSHDLDYEGHPARIAVITDISERKRAVLALQESEERLRLALQSANQGLYDLDLRTGEASVSPEYAQMLGYDPETFHESNTAWRERLHPEDLARVSKVFEDYIAGKIPDYRVEFRQRTRDGQWKWILSIGKVQEWDAVGRPVRMLGTHTDITAMRQAEEEIRRLNLDLEKRVAERTAELAAANRELETFSYSVSHDLKAPLRGIDGYSRLLLEDHESRLDEEGKLFLGNIRRGVQQMSQLIEDLLAYSRMERRSLHSQPLDLSLQVATALNERLGDIEDRGMQVKVALHGITVQADPEGLAMVLRNLIDNALKFTRDSHPPKLTILAKVQEKSIIIGLADNGIGFDMQFHERIFEIFQRLQRAEDYPGTGVGLAIVRKTLQRMGGKVWAESAPGQGATFYLELPR